MMEAGRLRGREVPAGRRLILELCPSICFLFIYYNTQPQLAAIIRASIVEACVALVLGIALYAYERKVPWLMLEAALLSSFSAMMTYVLDSNLWYKLKGTVIPMASALALAIGLRGFDHNLLQMALAPYYPNLLDEGWRLLAWRTAACNVFAAALNETLWRTLPFDTWVLAMRILGPILSMLFASTFFAPLVVHYQRRSRLSRPPCSAMLPQIVAFAVGRQAGRDGRLPAPIVLELGPAAAGAAAAVEQWHASTRLHGASGGRATARSLTGASRSDEGVLDGVPPAELLAGTALSLSVWVRLAPSDLPSPSPRIRDADGGLAAPAEAEQGRRLLVEVETLASLCVPVGSYEAELLPTGARRSSRDGGHAQQPRPGHLEQGAHSCHDELEYRGSLVLPASLAARGHWVVNLAVRTERGSQLAEWTGSAVLVGSYSARSLLAPQLASKDAGLLGAGGSRLALREAPLAAGGTLCTHPLPHDGVDPSAGRPGQQLLVVVHEPTELTETRGQPTGQRWAQRELGAGRGLAALGSEDAVATCDAPVDRHLLCSGYGSRPAARSPASDGPHGDDDWAEAASSVATGFPLPAVPVAVQIRLEGDDADAAGGVVASSGLRPMRTHAASKSPTSN